MSAPRVTLAPAERTTADSLPVLYLKRREDRRVRLGHPWVFSNEVDTAKSPLVDLDPGETVQICASNDTPIGVGYVNPRSLICVRMLGANPRIRLDRAMLSHRLRRALALRTRIFSRPFYRLAHGEGDALPGLVVDRYGDVLSVQIGTAGMERARPEVISALEELIGPRAIVLRNDLAGRTLEGLSIEVETASGTAPERIEIEEDGIRFLVSVLGGQKTGWYFDQRQNRQRIVPYVAGARVLDVFSYTGGFGVRAAVGGARQVVCVDSSRPALEQLEENARLNRVEAVVQTLPGDAFHVLKELAAAGERFDIVILDPPAFIARKKDIKRGTEAYQRINRLAFGLLEPDGFLVSASCSSHLSRERLRGLLFSAARSQRRALQIVEQGHQGPDHPIHPAMPESEYLKLYLTRSFRPGVAPVINGSVSDRADLPLPPQGIGTS